MNCRHFQRRLNQLLDRRSSPSQDALLRAHADDCPHCAALLRLQRDVLQQLEHRARPSHVASLPPRRGKGRLRAVKWVGWAIAASLLVMLITGRNAQRRYDSLAGRDRPVRAGATSAYLESADPAAAAADSQPAWRTTVSIASPVAWGLVVHRADLAGYDYRALVTARTMGLGWWQPIEAGLAPLVQSLSSAANVLRSIWPPADDGVLDSVSRFSHCHAIQVS